MNLSILCVLLVALLNGANSKSDDNIKNKEDEITVKQKQHKRDQKYEMREVILYLTPSQIRALEAEQGLKPRPELSAHLEKSYSQQTISNIQSQKHLQEEAQQSEKEQRLQLEQYIQRESTKQSNEQTNREEYQKYLQKEAQTSEKEQRLQLEQNIQKESAKQSNEQINQEEYQKHSQEEAQTSEKEQRLHLEQYIQSEAAKQLNKQINREEYQKHLQKEAQKSEKEKSLQLEQYIQSNAVKQSNEQAHLHQDTQHQLLQHAQSYQEVHLRQQQLINQAKEQSLSHKNQPRYPQSYSYLYFYPRGNQKNTDSINLAQSQSSAPQYPSEPDVSQKHLIPTWPTPQFKLVPYNYNPQKLAEAIDIYNHPISTTVSQQISNDNFNGQIMELHKLQAHEVDVQQFNNQDPRSQSEHLAHLPNAASSQSSFSLDENLQQSKDQFVDQELKKTQQETKHVSEQLKNLLRSHKEENPVNPKLQEALQLKAHLEQQEKFDAQHIESLKLDAHLKSQELQAEIDKAEEIKAKHEMENQELEHYTSLQQSPSKLFNSNVAGHSDTFRIANQRFEESLNQKYLPQTEQKSEGGFKPLVYSPKDDPEKYGSEVKKSWENFHKEKQEALAKVAAIAQSPPVVIHQEEKIVRKTASIAPYYVPVPQPYPIPIEIINQVPVPIVKIQK